MKADRNDGRRDFLRDGEGLFFLVCSFYDPIYGCCAFRSADLKRSREAENPPVARIWTDDRSVAKVVGKTMYVRSTHSRFQP
jgi:hypothetical protein